MGASTDGKKSLGGEWEGKEKERENENENERKVIILCMCSIQEKRERDPKKCWEIVSEKFFDRSMFLTVN